MSWLWLLKRSKKGLYSINVPAVGEDRIQDPRTGLPQKEGGIKNG